MQNIYAWMEKSSILFDATIPSRSFLIPIVIASSSFVSGLPLIRSAGFGTVCVVGAASRFALSCAMFRRASFRFSSSPLRASAANIKYRSTILL